MSVLGIGGWLKTVSREEAAKEIAGMSDGPLTPPQIAQVQADVAKEGYINRALVGFDQFVASLLDVPNDQTLSSAAEIAAHKKVWYAVFAKALNAGLTRIDQSHGQKAQVGDIVRAQEVIATDTVALEKGQ